MTNLFERTSSPWVRYSSYERKQAEDGNFYLTPEADAKPRIYNPLRDPERLVLDALNTVPSAWMKGRQNRFRRL